MQSVLVDRESLNLSLDRNFRLSTFNLTKISRGPCPWTLR